MSLGSNINHVNCYGNSPLHEATRQGFLELSKLLVGRGANINLMNNRGSTPLHFCCYGDSNSEDCLDILKFLISSGANFDTPDSKGMTPLLVCCTSGRLSLLTYLKQCGANIAVKDSSGRGMYEIALFYKQNGVVSLLENNFLL